MDVNEHKKMNESNALVAIFHLVCSKDTKVLSLQFSSLHLTYKCLYGRQLIPNTNIPKADPDKGGQLHHVVAL
jgi:hypothetical protein